MGLKFRLQNVAKPFNSHKDTKSSHSDEPITAFLAIKSGHYGIVGQQLINVLQRKEKVSELFAFLGSWLLSAFVSMCIFLVTVIVIVCKYK